MLIPKVYIPQVGILAGRRVVELDLRPGILVRRLKPIDVAMQIQALEPTKYLYIQLSHGNLQDKTLKKLIEHLSALSRQIYIATDSSTADGLADILHCLDGIELNYKNTAREYIQRISLLAANRPLMLNLFFDETYIGNDWSSFLPLFAQLQLSNINLYLPNLDKVVVELPDNVKIFKA